MPLVGQRTRRSKLEQSNFSPADTLLSTTPPQPRVLNMSDKVTWLTHEFSVHQHGDNWNAVPGLYIFTGVNREQKWYPLYVGQAVSLAERIPNHERWQEAQRLGATHVHAMVVKEAAMRDAIEKQLCSSFQPCLNTHLK